MGNRQNGRCVYAANSEVLLQCLADFALPRQVKSKEKSHGMPSVSVKWYMLTCDCGRRFYRIHNHASKVVPEPRHSHTTSRPRCIWTTSRPRCICTTSRPRRIHTTAGRPRLWRLRCHCNLLFLYFLHGRFNSAHRGLETEQHWAIIIITITIIIIIMNKKYNNNNTINIETTTKRKWQNSW